MAETLTAPVVTTEELVAAPGQDTLPTVDALLMQILGTSAVSVEAAADYQERSGE